MNVKLKIALSLGGALLIGSGALIAQDKSNPDQLLADLQKRAAAAQHQASIVGDEKQIEKLQRAYGYYIDKKMWDQAADLFADDATYELGLRGVYVGKAHIRHSLDMFGPQGIKDGELFNHMQLQIVVHVADDGKTAKVRSRTLSQVGEYGKHAEWGEGVYENEFVKRDGVWKFSKLHYYPTFVTPYDKGWGKEVLPDTPAPKGFEPDQPPTLVYQHYPHYFVPPFHYPNPVTGKPVQIGVAPTAGAK